MNNTNIIKINFTPEEDFTQFNKFVKTDGSASGTNFRYLMEVI